MIHMHLCGPVYVSYVYVCMCRFGSTCMFVCRIHRSQGICVSRISRYTVSGCMSHIYIHTHSLSLATNKRAYIYTCIHLHANPSQDQSLTWHRTITSVATLPKHSKSEDKSCHKSCHSWNSEIPKLQNFQQFWTTQNDKTWTHDWGEVLQFLEFRSCETHKLPKSLNNPKITKNPKNLRGSCGILRIPKLQNLQQFCHSWNSEIAKNSGNLPVASNPKITKTWKHDWGEVLQFLEFRNSETPKLPRSLNNPMKSLRKRFACLELRNAKTPCPLWNLVIPKLQNFQNV